MEADKYSGEVSDLENIFCSTEDNYYWYQLTRSKAATAISVRQNYCYHAKRNPSNRFEWPEYIPDKNAEEEILYRGDLRLGSVMENSEVYYDDDDNNSSNYGTDYQTLNKKIRR